MDDMRWLERLCVVWLGGVAAVFLGGMAVAAWQVFSP